MISEVQQLIVQKIQHRGKNEQKTDVRRNQPIEQRPDRYREAAYEEYQQDRREQDRLVILAGVESGSLVREKRMVLDRVSLEDLRKEPRPVMHGPAVPEVLTQVGIEKRQWNRQPFERPDALEHRRTCQRNQQTDTDRSREMARS